MTMTKSILASAFLLGAAAITWMAITFIGTDALALTITLVIGGVYLLGSIELFQYRQVSSTLANALDGLPAQITELQSWLNQLHTSLQNPVQLRIEGERVALPSPVLTPYLVGLLVMLGLLGTFVGMVDTLQGAVIALEGNSELQAIRAGLAAPIQGLGLAFGTSVAGVAASAMLGLMSTLSQRDRMVETRRLDRQIATVFREFSLVHNRQQTYKALQMQAQLLPEVAVKLAAMTDKMEQMGTTLSNTLTENQSQFHQSIETRYTTLASSLDKSLQDSARQSSRLAAESIQPIMQAAMTQIGADIKDSTQSTHLHLTDTAKGQLDSLSEKFSQATASWTQVSTDIKDNTQATQQYLSDTAKGQLDLLREEFSLATASWMKINTDLKDSAQSTQQHLSDTAKGQLDSLTDQFTQATASWTQISTEIKDSAQMTQQQLSEASKDQLNSQAEEFSQATSSWLERQHDADEQRLERFSNFLQDTQLKASTLQQNNITAYQEQLNQFTELQKDTTTSTVAEISKLLSASESLVQARIDSESNWLQTHQQRMDQLTATIQTELSGLTSEEERRSEAAIERLAGLESTVTEHLARLGKELEAPMTQLIETASETPRAAAEVISHLRKEISNNIERDNQLLQERQQIMQQLNTLAGSLNQSADSQGQILEHLVSSSTELLEQVGTKFSEHIDTETSKISDIVTHFSGSAAEMASLGESFNLAVQLFNESNGNLIGTLTNIEASLEQSSSRSDEQLGYYVAQAREIIDHSILSQKQMIEELRQLGRQENLFAEATS